MLHPYIYGKRVQRLERLKEPTAPARHARRPISAMINFRNRLFSLNLLLRISSYYYIRVWQADKWRSDICLKEVEPIKARQCSAVPADATAIERA